MRDKSDETIISRIHTTRTFVSIIQLHVVTSDKSISLYFYFYSSLLFLLSQCRYQKPLIDVQLSSELCSSLRMLQV